MKEMKKQTKQQKVLTVMDSRFMVLVPTSELCRRDLASTYVLHPS